jgi:hypothetical protein
LFGADQQKNPYTGALSKEAQDYNGPRSAKPIVDAVLGMLSDVYVTRVTKAGELTQFLATDSAKPKVCERVRGTGWHDVIRQPRSPTSVVVVVVTGAGIHSHLLGLSARTSAY